MCFGWLVKELFHPKRILILNWRNQDFIPAFTQWTTVNKKTFYSVKFTSGFYFSLESTNHTKNKSHFECKSCLCEVKKKLNAI